VAARRGIRIHRPAFSASLLAVPDGAEGATWRFGFTATRKLGNAVVRNRIRRRLRSAIRAILPDLAADPARVPALCVVIIAKPEALDQTFSALRRDLLAALRALGEKHARASFANAPRLG
jgi:ribonuclease P protein component